jgi:hypothetical protein
MGARAGAAVCPPHTRFPHPGGVGHILGVTELESVGISVDPSTETLKRLPAISLKPVSKLNRFSLRFATTVGRWDLRVELVIALGRAARDCRTGGSGKEGRVWTLDFH